MELTPTAESLAKSIEEAGLRSKMTKGCRSMPPFAGSLTAMIADLLCSAMSAKIAI